MWSLSAMLLALPLAMGSFRLCFLNRKASIVQTLPRARKRLLPFQRSRLIWICTLTSTLAIQLVPSGSSCRTISHRPKRG